MPKPKSTTRRRISKKKGGAKERAIPVVVFRSDDEYDDDFRVLFDSVEAIRSVLPELLAETRMSTYAEAVESSGKTAVQVAEHLATKNAVPMTLGNGLTVVRGMTTIYSA